MKYAIISDIHSNYKALCKVLVDIKQREVDKIISLGDQIGYGLFPDAVLNELQKQNVESIMGNHELALFDKAEYNAMSREGRTVSMLELELSVIIIKSKVCILVSTSNNYNKILIHGFL